MEFFGGYLSSPATWNVVLLPLRSIGKHFAPGARRGSSQQTSKLEIACIESIIKSLAQICDLVS
jgi:hypothetical protein